MNYQLNNSEKNEQKQSFWKAFRAFAPYARGEKKAFTIAFFAILINSGLNLLAPVVVGKAVDLGVIVGDYEQIIRYSGLLIMIFVTALVAGYVQTMVIGGANQRMLFGIRNAVFTKLSTLPVAFFNQNKAGDLISRINNDTDKLNQFFSQALMQFVGNAFIILGAGVWLVVLDVKLGLATLAPAAILLIVTQVLSPWIKRKNAKNLQTTGGLSARIQESLENFKVIVAFNRRDYFNAQLRSANEENYQASVAAGVANNTFTPMYGFASQIAVLVVLVYGTYLIMHGNVTIGLLISFLGYTTRFYDPLRQIASFWTSFQLALAAWDRIHAIFMLENTLTDVADSRAVSSADGVLAFKNVGFSYPGGKQVLSNADFVLEPGKTYALVGPTGGGKTTTASLMARLYDPTQGEVLLSGKDIRSYSAQERTNKIGFILQEPFLFSGAIKDNLAYGNDELRGLSDEQINETLRASGLDTLLARFEDGIATKVAVNSDSISLGQRQLVAFMRAVLRKPDLLILDEATANIDTVTEQLLEEVIAKLPATTTRVIIAHRLNTIQNADEIFFVNGGEITPAGSLEHAVEMLLHHKRDS